MCIKEIQNRWEKHQLIGLDIIINNSGIAKNIDISFKTNDKLPETFNKEYVLIYHEEVILADIYSQYDDLWSEIQINNTLLLPNDDMLFCGEGEMGNEGFIVRTDKHNRLQWLFFSTQSNPFTNITKIENTLYFQSTLGFYVALNILNNHISIINENVIKKKQINNIR